MDFTNVDGVLHIHLDNFFILGIACLCYFLGRWIKSEIKLLQDLSIPVPFIGGLPAAIVFACLKRQLPAFFYSLPRGSLKTATVA